MSLLPEGGDPWLWVEWMLGKERDLYVRIPWENPRNRGIAMTLVPMLALPPNQWVFHTKRIYFDHTYPVMPYDAWREREERLGMDHAAYLDGDLNVCDFVRAAAVDPAGEPELPRVATDPSGSAPRPADARRTEKAGGNRPKTRALGAVQGHRKGKKSLQGKAAPDRQESTGK